MNPVTHHPGQPYRANFPGTILDGQWRVDCSCGNYSAYDHHSECAEQAARKHAESTGQPREVAHWLYGPYGYLNGMYRAWCRCWTSPGGYMTDFCVTAAEAERRVAEHISYPKNHVG